MKKCTSAVFWCCHSPSDVLAIQAAIEKGDVSIGAWFGNAPPCTHQLDPFLHQFQVEANSQTSHPLAGKLEANELVIFMDMYSRVSRARGLSVHELTHTAHIYFGFFTRLLLDKKTELVLFSSPPHFGVDYLLYLAARKLQVEAIFCHQSLFPERFFFARRLEDFGVFEDVAEQQTPPERVRIERTFKKSLFYMQALKHRPERPFASLLNDLRRNFLRRSSKPMSFAGVLEKYRETREWNKAHREMVSRELSPDRPYVYFPLQLQPEMTTSTLGGYYSDQITAIEVLNELLPEDWLIYVKENPKQTHRQRGATFMRRLAGISKVRYVDKSVDTYELLSHARFASTITGTVGWEAISGGKPALVFGRPWYCQLPGVIRYRDGLSLQDILDVRIEHQSLEQEVNQLLAKSQRGVIDPGYSGIVVDYQVDRNAGLLADFLSKALEGSLFKHAHMPRETPHVS